MKIGIIGFGKMGMLHAGLFNSIDGVELHSIADTSRFMLRAIKSVMPHIQCYDDGYKLIENADIDMAVVSTPVISHYPLAMKLIEKGVDFFIEKPLCMNAEQAKTVEKAAIEKRVKCYVGVPIILNENFIHAAKIIKSGALGHIEHVKAEIYSSDVMKPEKGWRFKKSIAGGGVTIDLAVHIIFSLVYLFGEPTKVSGKTEKIHSEEVEDSVSAVLTFPSGFSCELNASWSEPKYRKSTTIIKITGEKASLELFNYNYRLSYEDGRTEEHLYQDIYEGVYLNIAGTSFSRQAAAAADFFRKGEFSPYNLHCAAVTQKIIDLIYESSSKNNKCRM